MLEDIDLELEEPTEVEAEEAGERQNRTFIILVAVMGGLLLVGIIAFCIWMFTLGRGILFGGRAAVAPTAPPEAAVVAAAETATAEAAMALAQVSPEPTATLPPSPTPVPPSPTLPPTIAAPQTTPTPRVTPTVAATSPLAASAASPTPTVAPSPPAQTGIGAYTALILAAGLIILLVISRRLRTAPGR